MKQIRRHFTYANVMSSFAVFLILGGATAFAAVKKVGPNQIKANSIKTGKIVKEAVKAGKLAKNAVIENKIADGAVTTNKLADNAVTTPKIANDAVTGEKVNESTLGEVPKAASASIGAPAAYAQIDAGGGINETEPSRGITDANVANPTAGIYCVDLAFAPQAAAGNAEAQGGEDGIISLQLGAPFNTCPATAEAEVRVLDASTGTEDPNEDVWIQFDS